MKKFIFLVLIVTSLASCSVYNAIDVNTKLNLSTDQSISDIQTMSSQQLLGVSNNDLCVAYYQNKPPLIKKEIERRGLITESSVSTVWAWDEIEKHEVKKGMSMCAVLASLGKPTSLILGDQFLELHYPMSIVILIKNDKGNYQVTNIR
ncbi:hypothetical protein L3V86_04820 [Thiotrichales bacterium 19S11-10]|nr:hypothetical protein [Thiotrichales bacterium 19S11-10]